MKYLVSRYETKQGIDYRVLRPATNPDYQGFGARSGSVKAGYIEDITYENAVATLKKGIDIAIGKILKES